MKRSKKVIKVKGTSAKFIESSDEFMFIERRIITGLVVSTDYINQVHTIINSKLIGSQSAKTIANWCLDYYKKYQKAPGKEIESIFVEKTKGLEEDFKRDIEDILAGLSDEYERSDKFNVQYLVDQTREYLDSQNIDNFIDELKEELANGEIDKVKGLIRNFKDIGRVKSNDIDFANEEVLEVLKRAFDTEKKNVIKLPRQLGDFMNEQMVRGGFVAFQGPEKRGKTWLMIGLAMIGLNQRSNIAFFQAGDMTDDEFVKRIAINLNKKSDNPKYTVAHWESRRDCIFNQFDNCDREERECDFGVFENTFEDKDFLNKAKEFTRNLKLEDLVNYYRENKGYKVCHNCTKYWKSKWGANWIRRVKAKPPLTYKEAEASITKFFINHKRHFKLATYSNKTLTVGEIYNKLDIWEKEDGFVPDVIFVDYADILAAEIKGEIRHQENDKWQRLRALSQDKHALVITATQADAKSAEKDTVGVGNFSEDKRKYGHVTAMYGLSQDRLGKEKEKGILRINDIVKREGDFNNDSKVYVLQNLKRGIPISGSYF